MDATHVCTIGNDDALVDFDAWSAIVDASDELRPEPFTGRDPATGMPMEHPPSAILVSLIDDGNVRGRFWYDENHRTVLGSAKPDDSGQLIDCAAAIADTLGVAIERT